MSFDCFWFSVDVGVFDTSRWHVCFHTFEYEPSRFSPHLIAPSPVGSVLRRSPCAGVAASTTPPPGVTTRSSKMSNQPNARGSTDVPVGKKSSTKVLKTHDDEASSKVAATIDYDSGRGGDDLQYGKTLKSRFAAISGGKGIERRDTRGNGRVLVGRKANLEDRPSDGQGAAVDAALPAGTAAAADPAGATAATAAHDAAARAADDVGPGLVHSPVREGAGSRWDNIRGR